MEKYKHIIDGIVCGVTAGKLPASTGATRQLTTPPDPTKTMDELRRINYLLQNEKSQLEDELKSTQKLYRKLKKQNGGTPNFSSAVLEKNIRLEKEVTELKDKLKRETNVKAKIQSRLYSMQYTYSSRDVTLREMQSEHNKQSLNCLKHERSSSRHTCSKEEISKSTRLPQQMKKHHERTQTLPAKVRFQHNDITEQPKVQLSMNFEHLQQIKRLQAIITKQKDLIESYEQQLVTDRSHKLKPLYQHNLPSSNNKRSPLHQE